MENNELISIIVPVYNVEKYLNRCIESITNQTYKDMEIILIDDGSIDNSGNLCDKWSKKDNRIIVIHKENGGVSSARNVGIDIAKGKYIAFVDSDDYIDNTMYEKMIKNIIYDKSQWCICNVNRVELNGKLVTQCPNYKKINNNIEIMSKMYNYNRLEFSPCNKVYKSEFVKKIRFDCEISIQEDGLFNFQYLDIIKKVSYINEPLYYYVQNEFSALHKNDVTKYLTSLDAEERIIEILKKNKIDEFYEQEGCYIGNLYKYVKQAKKEGIELDFSHYCNVRNLYMKNILFSLNCKLKVKMKVIYYILKDMK